MEVKIAELKNNLSRYLHKVSDEGQIIIVCDRDRPVACISPLGAVDSWETYRQTALARARQIGIDLEVPASADIKDFHAVRPAKAPDGRTDINTIQMERKAF